MAATAAIYKSIKRLAHTAKHNYCAAKRACNAASLAMMLSALA